MLVCWCILTAVQNGILSLRGERLCENKETNARKRACENDNKGFGEKRNKSRTLLKLHVFALALPPVELVGVGGPAATPIMIMFLYLYSHWIRCIVERFRDLEAVFCGWIS